MIQLETMNIFLIQNKIKVICSLSAKPTCRRAGFVTPSTRGQLLILFMTADFFAQVILTDYLCD